MNEVIAIPLRSERRAALVLAALRRLEAEYRVTPPAAGGVRRRLAGVARDALRRGWRLLRRGAGPVVAGGVIGALLAACCAGAAFAIPGWRDLLGSTGDLRLALLLGLVLGAVFGLTISAFVRRGRDRRDRRDRNTGEGAGAVSWLVSYVAIEPNETGTGSVRLSVLRLTLPEGAAERLKAILQQAATPSAA